MSKKYQYLAGLDPKNGEIIYSPAEYDFVKNSNGGYVDGGPNRCRSSGVEIVCLELSVSPAQLYEDWNSGRDEYGVIRPTACLDSNPVYWYYPKDVKVVPKNEAEDRQSFAFKRKMAMWRTYGPNGDQPGKMIMLEDAETDHLTAILDTQNHIQSETRTIIESILKDRANS